MYGVLTFSRELLCQREVLGKTFDVKIGEIDCHITFPSLVEREDVDSIDKVGMSNPLLAPEKAKQLKREKEPLIWGYPMNYPAYDSCVYLALLECECEEIETENNAIALYSSIERWEKTANDFIIVCTRNKGLGKKESYRQKANLQLLSNGKYIPDNRDIVLNAEIYSHECFLSESVIESAFEYASSGKTLMLEYEMMLSAYFALEINQNRQAIIDSCSAVEVCLKKKIEDYCKGQSINSNVVFNKFRSLGDYFELVTMMDRSLPKHDYQKIIVKPRNDVSHNRETDISDKIVKDTIHVVEDVLNHYHSSYY